MTASTPGEAASAALTGPHSSRQNAKFTDAAVAPC